MNKDIKALLARIDSRLKYAHFGYIKKELGELSAASAHKVEILDVGCGPGNLGLYCRDIANQEWHGIDLWKNELIQAQQVNSYVGLLQANLVHGIPFRPNSFDAIICNEVLMYMPNSKELLQQFHGSLKPSGKLIVYNPISAVPMMAASIKKVIRKWAQATDSIAWDSQSDWKKAVRATRINYYSYDSLINEVAESGFTIIDVSAFRIFRNRIRFMNRFENSLAYRKSMILLASKFPRLASDIVVSAVKNSQ
ncbi:MAG: methyltransferase domain-containing protein [Syntrophaceae bacterium]|nr:methyltransferase domain-containing protein [Syntrophaceae bacterium]